MKQMNLGLRRFQMKNKLRDEAYKALKEKSKEAFDIFINEVIRPDDNVNKKDMKGVEDVYCTGFQTGYAVAIMEEIQEAKMRSGQYAHFNTDIH